MNLSKGTRIVVEGGDGSFIRGTVDKVSSRGAWVRIEMDIAGGIMGWFPVYMVVGYWA